MGIQNYGKVEKGRHRKLKRRIIGLVIIAAVIFAGAGVIGVLVSDGEGYQEYLTILKENHELRAQVEELQERVSELEGTVAEKDEYIASIPTAAPTPYEPNASETPEPTSTPNNLESPRG